MQNKLSEKFIQDIKNVPGPLHKLAWKLGMKPGSLYKLTCGIDRPEQDDPRVQKLCDYLGIPVSYAFEDDPDGKVAINQ